MDVHQLSRKAAPNGVLLLFELLLQHMPASSGAMAEVQHAPSATAAAAVSGPTMPRLAYFEAGAGSAFVQQCACKEDAPVVSFHLDGRRVEVVVDANGRWAGSESQTCKGRQLCCLVLAHLMYLNAFTSITATR